MDERRVSVGWFDVAPAPATSSALHPLLPCAVLLGGKPVALETFPISNELRYMSFATACHTFTTTQVMNYNLLAAITLISSNMVVSASHG